MNRIIITAAIAAALVIAPATAALADDEPITPDTPTVVEPTEPPAAPVDDTPVAPTPDPTPTSTRVPTPIPFEGTLKPPCWDGHKIVKCPRPPFLKPPVVKPRPIPFEGPLKPPCWNGSKIVPCKPFPPKHPKSAPAPVTKVGLFRAPKVGL